MLSKSKAGDVHQSWDSRASAQSTGKLHTELFHLRCIHLSSKHSNVHWLRQPKGWRPELRDWWERCNSSDVTVPTRLVLENRTHRGILRYTAAHQEQVLYRMPQRLWQDHPPSSAGSKHTEPTSPLLIFILVSFLQYFINQYFSEPRCAHWI